MIDAAELPDATYHTTGPQVATNLTNDEIEMVHRSEGVLIHNTQEVCRVSNLIVQIGGRHTLNRKYTLNSQGHSIVAVPNDSFVMVLEVLSCQENFYIKCQSLRQKHGLPEHSRFKYLELTDDVTIRSVASIIGSPKIYHKTYGGTTYVVINPCT